LFPSVSKKFFFISCRHHANEFDVAQMVVNVVMGKFGELSTLAGLSVNHHDTYDYRKLWAGTDVTGGSLPSRAK
jgi:hypothetical protein